MTPKDVFSIRLDQDGQDTLTRLIDLLTRPGMQVTQSDAMRVALTLARDVLDGRRLTHDQWIETERLRAESQKGSPDEIDWFAEAQRLNSPDRQQDEYAARIQAIERNPWYDPVKERAFHVIERIPGEIQVDFIYRAWSDMAGREVLRGEDIPDDVVVKDGYESPYRFARVLRDMVGDPSAIVFRSFNRKYYAWSEDQQRIAIFDPTRR